MIFSVFLRSNERERPLVFFFFFLSNGGKISQKKDKNLREGKAFFRKDFGINRSSDSFDILLILDRRN